MSKVVFFSVPAYGTINPTLPLVEELVNKGEEVIYYSTEGFREKIERTGSFFRRYPILEALPGRPSPPNCVGLAKAILSYTEQALQGLISETRREQVDYIIHDSVCFLGWAVAKKLRIPSICSTATLALNGHIIRDISQQSRIPGAQLVKTVILNGLPALKVWNAVRRLRKTYNIDLTIRNILNIVINRSDLNLVYTSKEFQPFAEEFDDSYRFVGPMIPQHADVTETFIEEAGREIIYISLGTVHNARLDFYRTCLAAFRDTQYLVVMSVGRNIDITDLGPLPSNFMIYNFVPSQIESLKKAKLFITHGGANGIAEGLFFGVPLLIFPQKKMELRFNARRVEDLGAGKILQESELNPDKLLQLGRNLIETDSYRKSAQMIGDSFRSAGGYRRAVQEIEDFKRKFVR